MEAKVLENGSKDFFDFLHEVRGPLVMKTDRAGFFLKTPVFRFSGLTVPKRPEIAKNDPKMTQIEVFLENGSKDFRDFLQEVREPKLKKTY